MNLLELVKLPDLVSLMNLLFGVASISLAHSGNYDFALILLLLAAGADGADGFVARKFGGGKLGGELDSLADAVSFGVAPALLICFRFGDNVLVTLIAYFYIVCGILRLARYNAIPLKTSGFQGLPITAGCVVLVSYLLIDGKFINEGFLAALTLALALLMAGTVGFPKVLSMKALGFIASVFGATVIMFFVDLGYMRLFSLLLFGLMLTYLISPFIKFPRKYYE